MVYKEVLRNSTKFQKDKLDKSYLKNKQKYKFENQLYPKNHVFIEADKAIETAILQPLFKSEAQINLEFEQKRLLAK